MSGRQARAWPAPGCSVRTACVILYWQCASLQRGLAQSYALNEPNHCVKTRLRRPSVVALITAASKSVNLKLACPSCTLECPLYTCGCWCFSGLQTLGERVVEWSLVHGSLQAAPAVRTCRLICRLSFVFACQRRRSRSWHTRTGCGTACASCDHKFCWPKKAAP